MFARLMPQNNTSNELTCRISASGKRLCVFDGEMKLYSVDVSAGLLKVTVERGQLNVWTRDTKLTCYSIATGEQLYQTAHNSNKLSKEDKKKRKKQYLSRIENEKKHPRP